MSNYALYCNDNLKVLNDLESESINMIYCDILYNSGKTFKDYDDNLGTDAEAYEWYKPRIKEMYRVLASNGSIFIQCNWRLQDTICRLLKEVFGTQGYRQHIARRHSSNRLFVNNFGSVYDDIFYFVKDSHNFVFNQPRGPELKQYPLTEHGAKEGAMFEFEGYTPDNRHWVCSRNELQMLLDNGEYLHTGGYDPVISTNRISTDNIFDDFLDLYKRSGIEGDYSTPKPKELLDLFVEVSTNPGDTCADFFMGGSGVFALSCIEKGRDFIGVDINKDAVDLTHSVINSGVVF